MNGLSAIAGAALLAAPVTLPPHTAHHEFETTPIEKLRVVQTRGEVAFVEGEQGAMALVHVDDQIGLEGVKVVGIGRGCLLLTGDGGQFSVCAEAPATPRS